jgi:peptidyl-prolyl cis-trans isomerase A (cyclophilin A)
MISNVLTAVLLAANLLFYPAAMRAHAPAHYRVRFVTTAGAFIVSVDRAWAPLGADRFYNLVKNGYYNGEKFFRVVPGFVVQFGLSGNPALNALWSQEKIADDPVRASNTIGTVSFADAGPGTRTTQLFINLGNNARLDGMGFAPIGRVTAGMPNVERIYGGYGEGVDQGSIASQGDAYLRSSFPRLTRIISARLY